jgi:hypothetical protein
MKDDNLTDHWYPLPSPHYLHPIDPNLKQAMNTLLEIYTKHKRPMKLT